jgi:hypothetical protein
MHQGQLVFAQLMRHLPLSTFRRCVAHYDGEHKVKSFSCLDQYLCMAFAQLTFQLLTALPDKKRTRSILRRFFTTPGPIWKPVSLRSRLIQKVSL